MSDQKVVIVNENVNQVAQGDVLFTRIDKLPAGVSKVTATGADHIITHSESGHHHVMPAADVDFYRESELVGYIEVKKETTLRHLRTYRTHEKILFLPGVFRINRQAEQTPTGWQRVAD